MRRRETKLQRRSPAHFIWALIAIFAFSALAPASDATAEQQAVEECELEKVDSVDDDLEETSLSSTARTPRGRAAERVSADRVGPFERGLLAAGARSPPAGTL